jgi:thiol-disulfide isomerase/thioredoxin
MLRILVAGAVVYYVMNLPPSLDLTKPSFTLYYASWCPHCKTMLPDWDALGSNVNGIVIRKLEQQQNTEYDVQGYPTIIYRDGNGNGEKYEGKRTLADFKAYLSTKV